MPVRFFLGCLVACTTLVPKAHSQEIEAIRRPSAGSARALRGEADVVLDLRVQGLGDLAMSPAPFLTLGGQSLTCAGGTRSDASPSGDAVVVESCTVLGPDAVRIVLASVPITARLGPHRLMLSRPGYADALGVIEVTDLYTQRPFNADFLFGLETSKEVRNGATDFSEVLVHAGLFVRSRVTPDRSSLFLTNEVLTRLRSLPEEREEADGAGGVNRFVDAKKAFEFETALVLRVAPWSVRTLANHAVALSLVAKLGGITTFDTDVENDLLIQTFFGVRLQAIGRRVNGAYFEMGTGRSENFLRRRAWRIKFEGVLPIVATGRGSYVFVGGRVQTDFGDAQDEITLVVGKLLGADALVGAIGSLFGW